MNDDVLNILHIYISDLKSIIDIYNKIEDLSYRNVLKLCDICIIRINDISLYTYKSIDLKILYTFFDMYNITNLKDNIYIVFDTFNLLELDYIPPEHIIEDQKTIEVKSFKIMFVFTENDFNKCADESFNIMYYVGYLFVTVLSNIIFTKYRIINKYNNKVFIHYNKEFETNSELDKNKLQYKLNNSIQTSKLVFDSTNFTNITSTSKLINIPNNLNTPITFISISKDDSKLIKPNIELKLYECNNNIN